MGVSLWMWLEAELIVLVKLVLTFTQHLKLSKVGLRLMKRLVAVGALAEFHPENACIYFFLLVLRCLLFLLMSVFLNNVFEL